MCSRGPKKAKGKKRKAPELVAQSEDVSAGAGLARGVSRSLPNDSARDGENGGQAAANRLMVSIPFLDLQRFGP